jgi:hypothetical protein
LWLMGSLSPMILFSPTFLSFIQKVHIYLLLNYNLSYIIFFNLVFVFFISNLFPWFCVKVLFFSISSFNQSLFCFFFQFSPHYFDFRFHLLNFFLFNLTLQFRFY